MYPAPATSSLSKPGTVPRLATISSAILRGGWPGDEESPVGFRCECATLGCNALVSLTPREYDVLALMAEGRSNQAIAEKLVISGRAVEKHVTSIFIKLKLQPAPEDHRRVLAVLAFLRG